MKVVLTNGCYDILHTGHFNTLIKCRELAGEDGKVIVLLDSDKKIKKDKGKFRPLFSFEERRNNLFALEYVRVNKINTFNTNEELYELIKKYKPNIIVKGSDWQGNVVGSDLAKVELVELYPLISSTIIEQRIEENFLKKLKHVVKDLYESPSNR